MKVTSKGFRKYDPKDANDIGTNVAQWITDDSTYNMDLLDKQLVEYDEKIKNASNVTLNDERQQNFNFTGNQVEKNGLVLSTYGYETYLDGKDSTKRVDFKGLDKCTLVVSGIYNGKLDGYRKIFQIASTKDGDSSFFIDITTGNTNFRVRLGEELFYIQPDYSLYEKFNIGISIDNAQGKATIIYNDKVFNYEFTPREFSMAIIGGIYPFGSSQGFVGKLNAQVYNRFLTPQEIQHNFSVINNSQSLKSTEITDTEGRKTTLLFSTDTHHVEAPTGRTIDEEYMGVLSTMGKEFVADAQGKIEVNNGVKARVISGEIQGNTIKNYCPYKTFEKAIGGEFIGYEIVNGKYCLVGKPTAGKILGENFKENTQYTIGYKAMHHPSVTSGSPLMVTIRYKDGTQDQYKCSLLTTIGRENFVLLYYTTQVGKTIDTVVTTYGENGKYAIIADSIQIVEGTKYLDIPLPSGLNSTQAIINNNNQSYEIYEPQIIGKTRTLRSPKGQNTWAEISYDEARDTVAYDYKLDSVAGDLGSVPNITNDYIARDKKVKVMNTNWKELNGGDDEVWTLSSTDNATCRFSLQSSDKANGTVNIISNSFTTKLWSADEELVGGYSGSGLIAIRVLKTKLSTPDVAGLKSYLAQQKANGTPVTVRYQLATPIEIPLTDEEFKVYDKHKKLISLGDTPSLKDNFNINDDGSVVYTANTIGEKLNIASLNWAKYANEKASDSWYSIKTTLANVGALNNSNICVRCNVLNEKTANQIYGNSTSAEKGIAISTNKELIISEDITKLSGYSPTMSDSEKIALLKSYIVSKGDFLIRYNINPIIITIPKELVPAILTNKTNILSAGNGVNASSFKVTVPTTGDVAREYNLSPINRWIVDGTTKAELLKNGDVRLILDLAVPSEFATTVCLLPVELRPETERTVLGYNGDTPVVVKVLPTGEVKCMTQQTGTIKLNDTYKL